nr:DNA cytosine methyltransferase [Candidatus Sigynarchaeota archaeon]
MNDPRQHQYNVLDLFSGAGGLSLGFEQAGFSVAAGVEIWEPAIQTYVRNHPRSKMINGDIRTGAVKQQIRALHEEKPIDIVIGGFPCQGFSMAGNRDPLDTRSQLYQEYLNVVAELKPVIFLMENVKGLKSMKVLPPNLPKRELDRLRKGLEKMQRYKDLKRYKRTRSNQF